MHELVLEDSQFDNTSSTPQSRSYSTGRLPFRFYPAAYFCRYTRKSLLSGGIYKLPSRVALSIGYTGRRYFATLPNMPKPIPYRIHCFKLKRQWDLSDHAQVLRREILAYRLAQGVRSREDPEESFLKGVPVDPGRLEIIYPVSISQSCCLSAMMQQQINHFSCTINSLPEYGGDR